MRVKDVGNQVLERGLTKAFLRSTPRKTAEKRVWINVWGVQDYLSTSFPKFALKLLKK